jgi:FdhD protein
MSGALPSAYLEPPPVAAGDSDLAWRAVDLPTLAEAPRLTEARASLLQQVRIVDAQGRDRTIEIPLERALTIYVDRKEVVTLMTLGVRPELLVLGWLFNQRLVDRLEQVESITVDWDVGAAAVRSRGGLMDLRERSTHRVVTTGCGQGTVFGDLMADMAGLRLPDPAEARIGQRALVRILEGMRGLDSVHRRAGSVHGCALFEAASARMLVFVEDVGRHNAVDTVTGWMRLHGVAGRDKVMCTTGRLTSEMVMKCAHADIPVVVSRNGATAMGLAMAQQLGMAMFGRASNRHFLCYSGFERFDAEPEPEPPAVRVISG